MYQQPWHVILWLPLVVHVASAVSKHPTQVVARKLGTAPDDVGWIKTFTALGDSYASGFGAGKTTNGNGDGDCGRFSEAYPSMMSRFLGSSVQKYTFLACKGATIADIKDKQISAIPDNSQDLVTISAGGDDVLFKDLLWDCVYGHSTMEKCDETLSKADEAIKKLYDSIDGLLTALDGKMADDSIVLWTLYGQFFNTEADKPCSDQTWDWFQGVLPGGGIKLTREHRQKLNDRVKAVNEKVSSALASFTGGTRPNPKYKLEPVSWENKARDEHGLFCEPNSADDPNDATNFGLDFIRLNPTARNAPERKMRARRDVVDIDQETDNGTHPVRARHLVEYAGDYFNADEAESLIKRAPLDMYRQVFHPTEAGHTLIAARALQALANVQSKGFQAKPCLKQIPPHYGDGVGGGGSFPDAKVTCNGEDHDKWAYRDPLFDAVNRFCKDASKRAGDPGSKNEGLYNQGTSNVAKLIADFKNVKQHYEIKEDACLHYFGLILDEICDVHNGDVNPLNVKHGGVLDHPDGYRLELQPQENHPESKCAGIADRKYADKEKLKGLIHEFCADVSKDSFSSSKVSRRQDEKITKDNPGEPKDVRVFMIADWPDNLKVKAEECEDAMSSHFIRNCDTGDKNPYDYKGGGDLHIGGVLYSISVLDERTPAPTTPAHTDGWCGDGNSCECSQQEWGWHGHEADIDKPTLQGCMMSLFGTKNARVPDFTMRHGHPCEKMAYMHMGTTSWQNQLHCWNACKNCLSENVNYGAKKVYCDAWSGSAHCWMGFDQG